MRSLPHSTAHDSLSGAKSISGGARQDRALAEAQLGAVHPIVGLLASLQTSIEQMWVVAAVAVIGNALLLSERRSPIALLLGAGAAELIPIARWASRRAAVREACLELVSQGCRNVRFGVLDRVRCRLADPRHRATLARSITDLVEAAQRRPTRPRALPIYSVRVVRSAAPELGAIAERLVTAAPALQGVALIEQLLRNGVSPLYGSEVEPLRRELGRARFLLQEDA